MMKDKILNEAVTYLQNYIRLQTVNPPGNELEGARFLKNILDDESIPSQIFEPAANRGNILAVLKGSGEKRPILLLTHIDVVPAEAEHWDVAPFQGTIKEGYIYGRGAIDNKSMGIVELMTIITLKRESLPLKRDIVFLASADEETGGKWGVQWALENIPTLKDAEFALNEGLSVILDDNGIADRYEVSPAQKVLFHLSCRARGSSGHASIPPSDNANVKMIQGLAKVTGWETPFRILPMVKQYFRERAPKQPQNQRIFFEDIERGLKDAAFSRAFLSNRFYNASVRDTVTLTTLRAGSKTNVIPSESLATLDCRLIPGASKDEFLEAVKAKAGEEIEVAIISESQSLPPSPTDTELYRAIQKYAAEHDPGCPVVPLLFPGGTDSRFLREKGMIAYDFRPFRLTEKELMRVHGHNERISIENLRFGMHLMLEIIKELAL
jgi:acetylornithine deacetylase/succinyl-diaminopimelate desuccinylase-like protein